MTYHPKNILRLPIFLGKIRLSEASSFIQIIASSRVLRKWWQKIMQGHVAQLLKEQQNVCDIMQTTERVGCVGSNISSSSQNGKLSKYTLKGWSCLLKIEINSNWFFLPIYLLIYIFFCCIFFPKVLIRDYLGEVDGIAYDWESELIYFTDYLYERIEVCQKNGSNRRTLFTDLHNPRGIAVYPELGYVM